LPYNELDRDGLPPLYSAIKNGNLESIENLIDCGASLYLTLDDGRHFNALCCASFFDNKDVLELILKKGGGIHLNKKGIPFRSNDELPPLHIAIQGNHVNLLETLIKNGAFLEHTHGEKKLTVLQISAHKKWDEITKILIKSGADLNTIDKEDGNSSLHFAAIFNHYKPLSTLLEFGANPDLLNKKGHTPLMEAIIADNIAIVKALLESGANPNIKDSRSHKQTALHIALITGADTSIIHSLLDNGVDILSIDINNKTPYEYLDFYNRKKMPTRYYSGYTSNIGSITKRLYEADTSARAELFQKISDKAKKRNKKFKM